MEVWKYVGVNVTSTRTHVHTYIRPYVHTLRRRLLLLFRVDGNLGVGHGFEALGEVVGVEFSVYTSGGVKIPDVIWMSEERRAQIPEGAEASPVVPELCVEVMSDSNTEAEMAEKRDRYFDGGAKEVWVVGRDDAVRFFDADSEIEPSRLAPDFPSRI